MKRRRDDRQFLPSVEFITHEKEITDAVHRLEQVTAELTDLVDHYKETDDDQKDT